MPNLNKGSFVQTTLTLKLPSSQCICCCIICIGSTDNCCTAKEFFFCLDQNVLYSIIQLLLLAPFCRKRPKLLVQREKGNSMKNTIMFCISKKNKPVLGKVSQIDVIIVISAMPLFAS